MTCAIQVKRFLAVILISALAGNSLAHAEEWCDLAPGWSVVTHGTKAENVFLLAQFQGAPSGIWIQIADATVGKSNVAMALAAQLAGKRLSLYLDTNAYTCATFPSWAGVGQIRHLRIID